MAAQTAARKLVASLASGEERLVKELTDGQLAKQARRLVLVRRNWVHMVTPSGVVPVRQVSISREDGKPTLVVG